jgi:hypothetical protein
MTSLSLALVLGPVALMTESVIPRSNPGSLTVVPFVSETLYARDDCIAVTACDVSVPRDDLCGGSGRRIIGMRLALYCV